MKVKNFLVVSGYIVAQIILFIVFAKLGFVVFESFQNLQGGISALIAAGELILLMAFIVGIANVITEFVTYCSQQIKEKKGKEK
jgi:hypothetical protein